MDIKQISRSLSQIIALNQRKKRAQQLGINPFAHTHTSANDVSRQIQIIVIDPIIKEIYRMVEQNITYQLGTSIGFYYLLANNRKFAVLYIPNPATGRIFMKRLNSNGMQCAPSEEVHNICQITDYLKEFNDSCNS